MKKGIGVGVTISLSNRACGKMKNRHPKLLTLEREGTKAPVSIKI
jgi:hypothetical protein